MAYCVVTGGAGFIGSHLVEALLERGNRVLAVDDESTGSVQNLSAVLGHPQLEYLRANVADQAVLQHITAMAEQVYHLAAAVGVALIAADPVRTIENNILPTALLLRALVRRHQQGQPVKFFLASSSEVYGKNPKPSWAESDEMVFGPTSRSRWAYGASKAIDEFLALAWHRQVGLPVVIGRFFNVVGPRQTGAYGMVLARFVEAALAGRPLVVHDDGQQIRSFVHVHDVVRAVLLLMDSPQAIGRVVNIGSDQPIRILELAHRVRAAIDPSLPIQFQSYQQAYGPDFEDCRRRVPDLTLLRQLTGFQPQCTLDQAIHDLIAWKRKVSS
ncbi:MAG: GDP-mannose 4,6-dehydratase [Thermoguttaceae bacterium]|nr:GDP-mannose 4,6-dehydratase [Thermoguttaceae bacterium]MDW8036578.1 GDP-mannose 4,6-dehydratase [Thermoguttaceae bacterium]